MFLKFFENSNEICEFLCDYMVYASRLGKSLFVTFGKSFLDFCGILTPGKTFGLMDYSTDFGVQKVSGRKLR